MSDQHENRDPATGPDEPGTGELPPRPGFVKRLWMVVARPAELFEALAPNPAWFPMAALVAVLVAASFFLTPAEAFREVALASGPPDGRGAGGDGLIAMVKWSTIGGSLVFLVLIPVILSALTYVIFVFMRGDRSTFRQHLCVISHTGVISALGSFVALPLRVINRNFQETLSLGDFVPFLEGYWYDVLNGMDLFAIWACLVAGLGLSVIDPRRRWGPTAAVLVGILLVTSVIGATLAALFTP